MSGETNADVKRKKYRRRLRGAVSKARENMHEKAGRGVGRGT
jgi:hypothetical protein